MPRQRFRTLLGCCLFLALAAPAQAQDLMLELGAGSLGGRTLEMIALIALLSVLPALLMMLTCFPFMVTVLSILRQGLGLQQSPPNMLIITLALFLTWYVMSPVLEVAWREGVGPILDGKMGYLEGLSKAYQPLQGFMLHRLDPSTYEHLAALRPDTAQIPAQDAHPSVLVPSFLLSEVSRAFQIGFLLYLPFLVIDMVVSAVLMSMGMMMVPPAAVSLPFKLAFFVAADGWGLVAASLVRSYN